MIGSPPVSKLFSESAVAKRPTSATAAAICSSCSSILPSGFMFRVMLILPSGSSLYCAAICISFDSNIHQIGAAPHHTAFHLTASLTPSAEELKKNDQNLISHYVSLVKKNKTEIDHFGSYLVCDGYFGVSTFVNPVSEMGINLISCLKTNAAIYYLPEAKKQGQRGRPAIKGMKINWMEVDNDKLPLVHEDEEKRVRSSEVWVKCLRRRVLLVAVEYMRENGTILCRKLYFCTSVLKGWQWVLERYGIRFQIEFLFRDAKQFIGLAHCQSTSKTKLENHANLALTALSVAKATHWLPVDKDQRGPFSVSELKTYYYNLMLLERFSTALGIDHNRAKNNPEIIKLLFSNHYAAWAA